MPKENNPETPGHDEAEETLECPCCIGEKFIQPCLLFLLHQKNAHGYELIENLKTFGTSPDPSSVYRNLRRMEKEGLVKSQWDTEGAGPAKRYYKLTADGEDLLHSWAHSIKSDKKILDNFLKAYSQQIEAQQSCVPCSTGDPCCVPPEEGGDDFPEEGFVPVEQLSRSENKARK